MTTNTIRRHAATVMAALNQVGRITPPFPSPPTTPPTSLLTSLPFTKLSSSSNSVRVSAVRTIASAPESAATVAMTSKDPNLEAIFKQKRMVRSRVRKELKAMDPTLRYQEDAAIQENILQSSWFKDSKRLCAYISCSALREVDTSKIVSEILSDPAADQDGHAHIRKKLYVPRVEDKNSHMRMFNISTTEDLIANSMDILEPSVLDSNGNQREDVMEASDPIDLVLVPGLAFDKSGRRLGRSGGYYDTFLRKYQELAMERKWKLPLLVALSYSLQVLEDGAIPVTQADVAVDALVTPSGVLAISPSAKERT